MIFLAYATGAQVQVLLGQASTIHIQASYGDWDGVLTDPETFATVNVNAAASGTNVIVPTPSSGHVRKLKSLFVRNKSASTSCDVTVQHYDGSTTCDLKKITLNGGQELHYVEGVGFYVFGTTSGLFLKRTVYTSGTNTFSPLSQSNSLYVTVVGGGGGGGASGTGNNNNVQAGGGGGSGAMTIKKYAVSTSATYTAVVGGGGAGGVAPSNNGTAGTLSSFTDTQINGAGGSGGVYGPNIAAAPQTALGGVGGAANANGDINDAGAPGGCSFRTAAGSAKSGAGGSSTFGGGGQDILALNVAAAVGAAATGYGAGGAGATSNNANGAAGGAGSGGIIIIDEYS